MSEKLKMMRFYLKIYQKKGYYNVNVKSSYAKNIDNEYFELIFNIDSGGKYFFNEILIKIPENFDSENFVEINKHFDDLRGKQYSSKVVNKILDDLDKIILQREYLFLNTKYDIYITKIIK